MPEQDIGACFGVFTSLSVVGSRASYDLVAKSASSLLILKGSIRFNMAVQCLYLYLSRLAHILGTP